MTKSKKVAVVTGAAVGIGQSISRALCNDGFKVIGLDINESALKSAVDIFKADGLEFVPIRINLEAPNEIRALPGALGEDQDNIQVIVNNAGISPKRNGSRIPFADMTLEEWEQVMRINLTGPFLVTQTLAPFMVRQGHGRIVMMASMGAKTATGMASAVYNASKAGVLGLTRALALEYAAANITVNAVCPGRIDTAMALASSAAANQDQLARTPLRRLGKPEEVADLVRFLASEHSSYITGAAIDINGGVFMA